MCVCKIVSELVSGVLFRHIHFTIILSSIHSFIHPSIIHLLVPSLLSQPVAADVWTVLRFHVTFIDVQLEFLQSQSSASSHNRSLSLFDIQRSDFTFESLSNQTRSVNFTSQAVIGYDTRYKGL